MYNCGSNNILRVSKNVLDWQNLEFSIGRQKIEFHQNIVYYSYLLTTFLQARLVRYSSHTTIRLFVSTNTYSLDLYSEEL